MKLLTDRVASPTDKTLPFMWQPPHGVQNDTLLQATFALQLALHSSISEVQTSPICSPSSFARPLSSPQCSATTGCIVVLTDASGLGDTPAEEGGPPRSMKWVMQLLLDCVVWPPVRMRSFM